MKKRGRQASILIVAGLLVIPFQNCSQSLTTSSPSSSLSPASSATPVTSSVAVNVEASSNPKLGRRNVEQFGFWGSGMDGVDSSVTGEVFAQVAGKSNVVFISGFDSVTSEVSPSKIREKIIKAKSLGLDTVLMVQSVYFLWGTVRLYPDAKARFLSLWTELAEVQSSVKAFYIYDEPYGNNRHFGPESQIHSLFVRDNLNFVARHLKSVAPAIPTVVVFGAEEINYDNFYGELIPKDVSWIGFDCYLMEGARCSEQAVRRHFASFEKVAEANGQSLVLIPDAFTVGSTANALQYDVVDRLRLYKEFASTSWAVKGIYPWLYQNHSPAPGAMYYGATSLAHVQNEFAIFYDVLLDKAHCDSQGNLVYKLGGQWSSAPACEPTCENGFLTYRDADGSFYVRSSIACALGN